ncbi:hypothetical protein EUX98_g4401 [Antrodiella citrinella]|uniref:Peptidase S9A N-terminal domain-containing protein n=1 Tax=Antrodiella citrinella TaxID=2447956 RepID=A0A4S4MU21_9APHY|nr:hypothetical protein EUX98_g4401 [Antrodiella citrinella]
MPDRYPTARRSDQVNVYKSEEKGKVCVPDPYNWLEENSEETDEWTTAQQTFTRVYLDQNLERKELEDTIRNSMDYAKSNLLSKDGTSALTGTAFSRSGEYFAYGISHAGSDFSTIYVRPTSSPVAAIDGKEVSHDDDRLVDEIKFVKFSGIAWTDSTGFFYQRFSVDHAPGTTGIQTGSEQGAMLYYHRVGTLQSEDVLAFKDESNPSWVYSAEVTPVDGKYVIVTIAKDTSWRNLIRIAYLEKETIGQSMQWDKLIDSFDGKYQ